MYDTRFKVCRGCRAVAVAAALLVAAACEDDGLDAAGAAAIVQRHRDHFAAFDRWARRTLRAEPALRDRSALEGTLFAPLRHDDAVVTAWVRRDEQRPLSLPGRGAMPDVRWQRTRDRELGVLQVGLAEVRDMRRRRRRPVETALLARSRPAADEGPEVTVIVAYARGDESPRP